MLKNKKALEEMTKLEHGKYTGQTINHWYEGVIKIMDFPKKPLRKVIEEDEDVEVQ